MSEPKSRVMKTLSKKIGRGDPLRSLLVPRPNLEPDRRSDEAKRLPDLVLQKSFEAEMQLHRFVGEQHKRWRSDCGLGHVIDLDPLRHRDRSLLEIDAI